ncbi:MAG: hybrid sensor histidine kinase/response regulator, partial [Balneolaceae bacterium]|nr:hybrid sensor histidine kinase/response regulator [Balneolaceae bacterium]
MKNISKKISLRSFLTIGPYEKDENFVELLRQRAQQGMFLYVLLGFLVVVVYVALHIFLVHKSPSWAFTGLDADTQISLFDKGFILLGGITMILVSYTSLSLRSMRILLFLLVILICLAMMMDDIATYDVTFTTAYTSLVLLVTVSSVPYTGWQVVLLCLVIIISGIQFLGLVPPMLGLLPMDMKISQTIYISVFSLLLTGISSQIYLNRYRQYRARQQAERLGRKLKERSIIMEKLKDRSEQQAMQLVENEKLKDRFFGNISHELRSPLTVILGPLHDLLNQDTQSEEMTLDSSVVRLMHRNAHHLLQLINQLLDLSKIDSGSLDLQRATIDLSEFVHDRVKSFIPLSESKQLEIEVHKGVAPLYINADPELLGRVIGNVITNAIKYSESGGGIAVTIGRSCRSPDRALITVTDSGPGISEQDLPHIFDRFYRGTQSAKNHAAGTGIGLALVKEITELHGGRVSVKSTRGEGSTFMVELPATPITGLIPANNKSTDSVSRKNRGKAGRKVLVKPLPGSRMNDSEFRRAESDRPCIILVDDNADMLEYLHPKLSRYYRVIALDDSSLVMEKIREEPVKLVISDVMMPEP